MSFYSFFYFHREFNFVVDDNDGSCKPIKLKDEIIKDEIFISILSVNLSANNCVIRNCD